MKPSGGEVLVHYIRTRAKTNPVNEPEPASLRARAHASSVAPVVATSSIINTGSPCKGGPRHVKTPVTLFCLRRRSRPTWGGVSDVLRRAVHGGFRWSAL